ncbi:hypothetical protein HZP42_18650 [Elizabethkingia anophelis]|uniref:hypothetical protein n=1 Tax=Elizabethkingia anophelis TaxID=1117645 RepID=UPI0006679EA3|nr:hypothetical protein [Elizabethkingia anophelis]AQW89225.1 hypothetical protein BBD28_00485 [Elizabethkingia anophelis]KUY22483.1 hypothetical protein ATB94_14355 [Elizabethkingia anophelis]MCT3725835.1 hypothetical protein [Elizabethkingia anophelis]MCT4238405.1 hypothetical protein [Elizabethkingia anophelis]MDV3746623.1 hypothetical protein [Elizabethkingia anophelis]
MKKILFILFTLMLLLSCNNKVKENIQEEPVPILIAVGYYPTFHQSIETIIDLKSKYILFYSPGSFLLEPPPPPSKNKELYQEEKNKYQQYLAMHPKPIPFKTSIEEKDIQKVREILNSFQKEDFDDKDTPTIDGMSINIVVVYSNDKIKQMRPLNNPTLKQEELYKEILNLLMLKNTDKNNSIIIKNLIR